MKKSIQKIINKRIISLFLAIVLSINCLPIFAFNVDAVSATRSDVIKWLYNAQKSHPNGWDFDHDGSVQCVDLIYAYYDFLGETPRGGNARDYVKSEMIPTQWRFIPDGQGTPMKGDILVYANGDYRDNGHVAIYESDYVTWHQNYSEHKYIERVTNIYYKNFKGWYGSFYQGCIRPDFRIDTPSLKKLDIVSSGIKISWSGVSDVQGYKIYRYESNNAMSKRIATVGNNVTSYTDYSVTSGKKYTYYVVAYNNSNKSGNSNQLSTVYIAVPTLKSACNTAVGIQGFQAVQSIHIL